MAPIERVELASVAIADTVTVTPPKVPVDTPAIVEAVQTKLRSLGYVGAGRVDGEKKSETEAAILDFRNRNSLPMSTSIDGELLAALLVAAPKEKPPGQEQATAASIAPEVKAVSTNLWAKFVAKLSAIPAFIGALLVGIVNNLGDAISMLTPLKDFLIVWLDGVDKLKIIQISLLAIVAVSGLTWVMTRQTGSELVKGVHDGTVKPDNREVA